MKRGVRELCNLNSDGIKLKPRKSEDFYVLSSFSRSSPATEKGTPPRGRRIERLEENVGFHSRIQIEGVVQHLSTLSASAAACTVLQIPHTPMQKAIHKPCSQSRSSVCALMWGMGGGPPL